MRKDLTFTGALTAELLLVAGLPFTRPCHAQQFSDWATAVNLGPIVNLKCLIVRAFLQKTEGVLDRNLPYLYKLQKTKRLLDRRHLP